MKERNKGKNAWNTASISAGIFRVTTTDFRVATSFSPISRKAIIGIQQAN